MAPRCRLPRVGQPWPDLAGELAALKQGDLDWRRARHSAYVWHAGPEVEQVALGAWALFMTENALGLRVFPSLARMEREVIEIVAELLHAPPEAAGVLTSGGTESIFLAAHAAREWARAQGLGAFRGQDRGLGGVRAQGAAQPEIVAPVSAHPAIDKAAHYLGMTVRRFPTRPDFRADPEALAAAIGPATVMLYASAPTYSLGVVDPIRDLGALAQSRGLWFHVDACVGGILGPFVRALGHPVPDFDLGVPGVTSISADLHKSGYTAKGASVLLFRSEAHRAAGLYEFDAWPTGRYRTHTFTGTRPGGAIAAAWAVLRHLGEEGYGGIARVVMEARARIEAGLARLPGGWHVWGTPDLWALALGARKVSVGAVAPGLTARGWHVARVLDPPGIHLMLTPAHAPFVEEYLGDLEAATLEALRGDPAPRPSPEPTSYA